MKRISFACVRRPTVMSLILVLLVTVEMSVSERMPNNLSRCLLAGVTTSRETFFSIISSAAVDTLSLIEIEKTG